MTNIPFEIERKFLVCGEFKHLAINSERIAQAYISDSDSENTVRVRQKGEKAYLTIKGKTNADGTSRIEWEKEIDIGDVDVLFRLCKSGMIDKTRYYIPAERLTFEVDVFHGENMGLIVAEIELSTVDQFFVKPDWLGEEVTGDIRYYNSQLTKHPFSKW